MNTQPDDLIEDALRTYPLVEVPPGLSQIVMGQIRAKNARIAATRMPFRLTWMDYALGGFLTLLPIIGLAIWSTLPRLVLLRLAFQWQLIQASSLFPVLGTSLAVTGILLFLAFIFSVNLVMRPETLPS